MELKQFIKEALLNIVDAVKEANESHHRFKIIGVKRNTSGIDGNFVDFDVSVIVNESSSGEVEGGVSAKVLSVVSVGIGSKMGQANLNQSTHRLTFKVWISENRID